MNVKLLRKVQKFLLAEPRRFVMKTFGDGPEGLVFEYYFNQNKFRPPCGTMACIGGTALWCENPRVFGRLAKNQDYDGISNMARRLLDLGEEETTRLFYFKEWADAHIGWPEKFEKKYLDAKTPLQRAKVGVARIEHFIKTKGAE